MSAGGRGSDTRPDSAWPPALAAATSLVAYIAVSLILVAAALTVVDVFMRSVVGRPIFGTNDIVILAMTLGVCGCFPYAMSSRRHMFVDVIGSRIGGRGYWILEIFGSLATLAVFCGFAVQFGMRADRLGDMNEGTQLLLIPLAPIWWIAAALLAFAAAVQAVVVLENVRRAASGAPAPAGETGAVS